MVQLRKSNLRTRRRPAHRGADLGGQIADVLEYLQSLVGKVVGRGADAARRSYGPPGGPPAGSGPAGPGGVSIKEWLQLFAVAATCTVFVAVVLPSAPSDGGSPSYAPDDPKMSVRHGKDLSRIAGLSPEYNAIALDVIRTLDCNQIEKDPWDADIEADRWDAPGGGEGGGGEWMDDFGAGRGGGEDRWDNENGDGGEDGKVAGEWDQGGWGDGDGGGNVNDGGGGGGGGDQGGDLGGWGPDERRRRRRRLQEDKPEWEGGWGDDGVNDAGNGGGGGDGGGDGGQDWNNADNNGGNDWNDGNGDGGEPYQYQGGDSPDDPDFGGGADYGAKPRLTAKHLLCLAAGADNLPDEAKKEGAFRCDAAGTRREAILDLWDAARSQMRDDVIKKTLDVAVEHRDRDLQGRTVSVWSPWEDEGLQYMLDAWLVGVKDYTENGVHGLEGRLGEHKLYVDVGSALGLTAMAVTFLYPKTAVLAIEPAPPTWFMQGLNFRCNLDDEERGLVRSVLGGVGPKNDHMAKMMWRPESTTSTRTWTPKSEHREGDIELVVRLRKFRSLLAEGMPDDLPLDTPVSVMNVDCEGCEYDLMPALTDSEFEKIGLVTGEVHWGYIPYEKKPSSDRAKRTHERMCRHEAVARAAKECCAFPKLTVRVGDNSWSDDAAATVADLAGSLCDGFDEWAEGQHLFAIDNDYGWIEISAEAQAWDT